jgi:hypothetical protein
MAIIRVPKGLSAQEKQMYINDYNAQQMGALTSNIGKPAQAPTGIMGILSSLTKPIRQGILEPAKLTADALLGTLERKYGGQGDFNTRTAVTNPYEQAFMRQNEIAKKKGDYNILDQAGDVFSGQLAKDVRSSGYTPTFVTQEELDNYLTNPLLETTKNVASVGAYALPGGGSTLGQAVGRGATAGAVGGFGASKTGEELQGAGMGALFGGAIGGAGFGIGKGVEKLQGSKSQIAGSGKEASQLAKDIRNSKEYKDILSAKSAMSADAQAGALTPNALERGISANDVQTMAKFKRMEQTLSALDNEASINTGLWRKGGIENVDEVVTTGKQGGITLKLPGTEKAGQLADDLKYPDFKTRVTATKGGINSAAQANTYNTKLRAIAKENGILNTGNIEDSLMALDDVKSASIAKAQAIRQANPDVMFSTKEINELLEVPAIKADPALRNKESIKSVAESFKNTIGKKETIDPDELYNFLKSSVDDKINYNSNLSGGSKTALKQMEQGIRGKLNSSLGADYVKANDTFATIQTFQRNGGDARLVQTATSTTPVLSKAGIVERGLNTAQQRLSPVAQKFLEKYSKTGGVNIPVSPAIGTVAQSPIAQRSLLQILANLPEREKSQIEQEIEQGITRGSTTSQPIDDNQEKRAQMFQELLSQGYKVSDAKSIVDVMLPEAKAGAKTGTVGAKDYNTALSGFESLNRMEEILNSDPSKLVLATIPGSLGARELENEMRNAMDAISRLRTGAAMTKQEEAFYRKFIPNITDSNEEKMSKIEKLRSYYESFLGMSPTSNTVQLQ